MAQQYKPTKPTEKGYVPDADEQDRLQRELQADIEQLEQDGVVSVEQVFTELYFSPPQMEAWQ
jgi:hypothetical protein